MTRRAREEAQGFIDTRPKYVSKESPCTPDDARQSRCDYDRVNSPGEIGKATFESLNLCSVHRPILSARIKEERARAKFKGTNGPPSSAEAK